MADIAADEAGSTRRIKVEQKRTKGEQEKI
jgi:hypothetical protein